MIRWTCTVASLVGVLGMLAACPARQTSPKMPAPDADGAGDDAADKVGDGPEVTDEETPAPKPDKGPKAAGKPKPNRPDRKVRVRTGYVPGLDSSDAYRDALIAPYLERARQRMAADDLDGAILNCRRILDYQGDHIEAILILGRAYYEKGWYEKAKHTLTAGTRYPQGWKTAQIWMLLGLVAEKSGAPLAEALGHYERAVQEKPNYARARNNLGAIYIKTRRYAKAIEAFRDSLNIEPNSALAMTNLGTAYRRQAHELVGNRKKRDDLLKKAEDSYRAAVALDREYGPAYLNLGLLFLDSPAFPGLADHKRLESALGYLREFKRRGWRGTAAEASPGIDAYLAAAQKHLSALDRADEAEKKKRKKKRESLDPLAP